MPIRVCRPGAGEREREARTGGAQGRSSLGSSMLRACVQGPSWAQHGSQGPGTKQEAKETPS